MQQTLSPIPSTSDLMELRNLFNNRLQQQQQQSSMPSRQGTVSVGGSGGGGDARNHLRRFNEYEQRLQKITLTGVPIRDVKIHPQDLHGFAKIRQIKRNQRSMLSESAAEDFSKMMDFVLYDDEPDDDDHNDEDHRSLRKSLSQQQILRNLKVRSLDRQQPHHSSALTSQR